ncbi:hypothetical protein C0991_002921 [Blastosporella zonata]|nr:hypothetical protein C0991_002921 [Blastosporella zonata]
MAKRIHIFILGATGYLGGSLLSRFIDRPDFETLDVTALVRSQDKADKLNLLGVRAIVGSFTDLSVLEEVASEADLVINAAAADELDAVGALLKGLEKRHKETGVVPSYIHTTFIILPSLVYGLATGKLVDLGVQNQYSIQLPILISLSLDRGQGGMIGEGKNIWPNVHIDDATDLYLVLFDAIIAGKDIGHGREGIYFSENGEHTFYDIGVEISKALVELGKGTSTEPTSLTKEELDKYFYGSNFFGANSRCRANRSRAIGWRPTKTARDLLASIKPEVESLVEDSSYKSVLARFAVFFSNVMQ